MCHQAEGGQGGFSAASYADVAKAVTHGEPGQSRLVAAISGAEPAMPKLGGPLEAEQVELIRRWVAEGAPDDSGGKSSAKGWWSLQPIEAPVIPTAGGDWARNAIDRFVAAKLAEKGLTHAEEADRRTLIRRLTYDLHGLPPTPEEIDAFVEDPAADAYEQLVERLLASPRYGERWGRHWLDVAHYGESHGYDKDKPRRNAWPYRDYVIDAFNTDKPYERFVREQLAGDILYPGDPNGLIATGFIAAGPWDFVGHSELREGTKDKKIVRNLDRDDMVAATMSTFSSLTVHCARCHDHKFDPIKQEDYYSLQAVFAGVERAEQPFDRDPHLYQARRSLWFNIQTAEASLAPLLDKLGEQSNAEIEAINERTAKLRAESTDLLPKVGEVDTEETIARRAEISRLVKELGEQRNQIRRGLLDPATLADLEARERALKTANKQFDALPEPEQVYSAAPYFRSIGNFRPNFGPRPVYLLDRGSVETPLEEVGPGAVTAVEPLEGRFDVDPAQGEGARRVALADWITDKRNPLTWRSIVNRVWHYHFGAGIVDSPNDFGRMGSEPTHPELLDWLAAEFRDNGGSIKDLHRKILLSATYRQSTAHDEANAAVDGGNQYLWRMNRTRLSAEAIRDAVLAVSGRLDLTAGGPSAEQFHFINDHSPIYDYARFDVSSEEARRRGVYRFLVRSVQDPFMESLDCADPSLLTPKRNATLTAVQALALMNDRLMLQEARHLAERLESYSADPSEQVERAYLLAFGRTPTAEESEAVQAHAARHGLPAAARLLLNSNEFLFID